MNELHDGLFPSTNKYQLCNAETSVHPYVTRWPV